MFNAHTTLDLMTKVTLVSHGNVHFHDEPVCQSDYTIYWARIRVATSSNSVGEKLEATRQRPRPYGGRFHSDGFLGLLWANQMIEVNRQPFYFTFNTKYTLRNCICRAETYRRICFLLTKWKLLVVSGRNFQKSREVTGATARPTPVDVTALSMVALVCLFSHIWLLLALFAHCIMFLRKQ